MAKLGDVFESQITGEWGSECMENATGVKVLRTANFTSEGSISYDNVAVRRIDESRIEKKKLHYGDILLEKSGGTEKTPVGRVVFCEKAVEDGVYLCNNFTQAMRVNQEIAVSKYVFYFMWNLHCSGRTAMLQNKTTGIRNLQIKFYLNENCHLPSLTEQRKIAAVLDKISDLAAKRRRQLEKLDELVKARFVEMFHSFSARISLSDVAQVTGGITKNAKREKLPLKMPYLRVANVLFATIDISDMLEIGLTDDEAKKAKLKYGDVLFVEGNGSPEQIGRVAIWHDEMVPCVHQNHLIKARMNWEKAVPIFVMYYFMSQEGREQIKSKAVSTSGLYTLSVSKVAGFTLPLPPLALQQQFAAFAEQIDKSKSAIQKSLATLETLKKALMQQYFM